MRVGIYVRVSTADQNNELQRRELREYAERHGWGIVQVYEDTVAVQRRAGRGSMG
jgi:DNA invertase Pin-like site-specific DNA recombinase